MQITTEIEKALAIMQEEGEVYTIIDDGNDSRIYATDKSQDELADEWNEEYADNKENQPTFQQWLDKNYEEIEVEEYDENGDNKYLVYTDSGADVAWDADLDNFIEECVLPEIPKAYRNYFDDEKYKQDCKCDGRGNSLARYDGHEREQEVNGTTYYLYKQ